MKLKLTRKHEDRVARIWYVLCAIPVGIALWKTGNWAVLAEIDTLIVVGVSLWLLWLTTRRKKQPQRGCNHE